MTDRFVIPAYASRQYLPNPNSDIEPPQYVATPRVPIGMTEKGNINLRTRPSAWNSETGGFSSVWSMGFQDDKGAEVLVPRVAPNGAILSEDEARQRYERTGEHLGKFSTPESSDAYAQKLHEQQEQMFTTARSDAALSAWGVSGGGDK
jgi:hypothetical protein